jgi:hypothetical protein
MGTAIEGLDTRHPGWLGYRELLARLPGPGLPSAARLCRLLPPGAVSGSGRTLRFFPAAERPGVVYERHIYETGEVPTRAQDWHDLFNALVWCRLPRLKAAMNAQHCAQPDAARVGSRGPLRDALTLLDESGALVISSDRDLLQALAQRDWARAFHECRDVWATRARIVLCGHALLDKLRAPYKAMTAHALLLSGEPSPADQSLDEWFSRLDAVLARRLLAGLCSRPADLSPLPLMGVPGWWSAGPQDEGFYADRAVFRAPPEEFRPAPLHELPDIRSAGPAAADDSPGS